jgi:hypothetical protein
VQAWGRLPLWNDRLELSAGTGPYRYFDTTAAQSGGDYSNTHGWRFLWSVRAAYYFDRRWIAQAQLNHVQVFGGPDTTALLFGIGYQLQRNGRFRCRTAISPRRGRRQVFGLAAVREGASLGPRESPLSVNLNAHLFRCVHRVRFVRRPPSICGK